MFNFSLPLLPFIHLPEDVRAFFQQIFSLLSLDITSIVSSPDCEWQLDTVGMYMVKIVFPLCIMLVILIVKDCVEAFVHNKNLLIRSPNATRPWQHVMEPICGYLKLVEKLSGKNGQKFIGSWNFGPTNANLKNSFLSEKTEFNTL